MQVRTTALRFAAVLALTLTLASCVRSGKSPFAPPGAGKGSIQVRVENQNFSDATVYAIRQGERIRLGLVTGKSQKSFTLGWDFSLLLEFDVDLVGGERCAVRPLGVDPGDRIWLRIPIQMGATPCDAGKSGSTSGGPT